MVRSYALHCIGPHTQLELTQCFTSVLLCSHFPVQVHHHEAVRILTFRLSNANIVVMYFYNNLNTLTIHLKKIIVNHVVVVSSLKNEILSLKAAFIYDVAAFEYEYHVFFSSVKTSSDGRIQFKAAVRLYKSVFLCLQTSGVQLCLSVTSCDSNRAS